MSNTCYNVLFIGCGNAARSIFAEAILNREGNGKFQAFSAGILPRNALDREATALLDRMNFDSTTLKPKSWHAFAGEGAQAFDFVFTVCEAAALLPHSVWRGQPVVAHWGVPDPATAKGNATQIHLAYADAFRMLSNRIGIFVNLPLSSTDVMSMQRQLEMIGRNGEPKNGVVAA